MRRSPRATARTRVTNDLAAAKRKITAMQGWWTVTGTVYVPDPDHPNAMGTWRDREPGEYPEDHPNYWASTVAQIDELAALLGGLREHARSEFHATNRKRGDNA